MNKKKIGGFLAGLASLAAIVYGTKGQHHNQTPPAPQPGIPLYTLTVHVCEGAVCNDEPSTHKAQGAIVTVSDRPEVIADGAGNADVPRLPPGSYHVCATATGYKERCADHAVPADGALYLGLEPERVDLPRLTVCGEYFCVNGQPWTAIETSDFSLYKRFLDGEDITPQLTERRDLGFNLLRVWLLNTSVIPGGLQPKDYPQFYDRMPAFVSLCAQYGLYVEFTAFTQAPLLMPRVEDQRAHWQRTQDALRGLAVLLELVNEYDHGNPPDNAPDRALWSMRPAGILASSGSADADSAPPTPVWDYVLYHSNDLDQWQRKVGHNAMEYADKYHVPAMANENMRYPDRDSSEAHAFDAAAGAALLTAGSCYHSQAGKFSTLFSGDERRFAAAWVAGAKSVPLEFRVGAYQRRDDLNGPSVIRAYEKRLPDGRSFIVRIRP